MERQHVCGGGSGWRGAKGRLAGNSSLLRPFRYKGSSGEDIDIHPTLLFAF